MQLSRLAESLSDLNGPEAARVPKYLLLSDGIARAVEAGELSPGERLPGEAELAAQLPASLGTIQKALAHLSERGLVVRRHGAGTFVADRKRQLHDLWHFRFLADDGVTLLPVFTKVEGVSKVSDRGPWAQFLAPDETFVRIERRIDVNGEFPCLSRLYIVHPKFRGLLKEKKRALDNANIRALLREKYGAPTLRIVEQVGAEKIPFEVCDQLALDTGTIGMVCHILGYGFRDAPLTYQLLFVPPGERRLEIQPRLPRA